MNQVIGSGIKRRRTK